MCRNLFSSSCCTLVWHYLRERKILCAHHTGNLQLIVHNLSTADEQSASRPGRFTPGERAFETQWGSVCPRASLDISGRYIIALAGNRTASPRLSTQQPSHYTNRANPSTVTLINVCSFNSRALYTMLYYASCSDGEIVNCKFKERGESNCGPL